MFKSHEFQKNLLKWYDKHRRVLPWRALKRQKANPYHVWLSEIMLQQTTVNAVIPYFEKFTKRWPTIEKLAKAKDEEVMREWAGLGYYARARNLLHCARQIVADYKGQFPDNINELKKLKGIGPYTASAISAIAFNRHAVVIDGNVERVTARLFALTKSLPAVKKDIHATAPQLFNDVKRAGDLAQSLMDLGATICIPQKPRCGYCPVQKLCSAYKKNIQNSLPIKIKKKANPLRVGHVYWLTNKRGQVLIEKRPTNRMLGDMMGLPTTAWDLKEDPPEQVKKLEYVGDVFHSFTHFDLKLRIYRGTTTQRKGIFVSKNDILEIGLPTVFKKIAHVMLKEKIND